MLFFWGKMFHFTSLYIMMLSQEITEMSHNESFKMFIFFIFELSDQTYICSSEMIVHLSTYFVVILNVPKGALSY